MRPTNTQFQVGERIVTLLGEKDAQLNPVDPGLEGRVISITYDGSYEPFYRVVFSQVQTFVDIRASDLGSKKQFQILLASEPSYPFKCGTWKEITSELFYYLLEVLPPIYAGGLMAVNEPIDHNGEGRPVYTVYQKFGERFFATSGTVGQMRMGSLGRPEGF